MEPLPLSQWLLPPPPSSLRRRLITKIADEIFKGNDNAAVEAQVLQIDKKLQKIEKDVCIQRKRV